MTGNKPATVVISRTAPRHTNRASYSYLLHGFRQLAEGLDILCRLETAWVTRLRLSATPRQVGEDQQMLIVNRKERNNECKTGMKRSGDII
jgi:hypothetical protein